MPRFLIEVKNDNSVETWTMDGGKQYLVVKKDEIIGIKDEKQIEQGYQQRKHDAIKQGQKDAWKLLEQFFDMNADERKECFDLYVADQLVRNYDCEDAIADLAAWKVKKEEALKIHLKDIVKVPNSCWFGKTGVDKFEKGVVVNIRGRNVRVIRCDGMSILVDNNDLIKTGEICESLYDFLDDTED